MILNLMHVGCMARPVFKLQTFSNSIAIILTLIKKIVNNDFRPTYRIVRIVRKFPVDCAASAGHLCF